jgi:predicted nucleic acid-binding Zn ribbon protein
MPMYEYHCESNGRLVEVQHKMDERLLTWGELCARAGITTGPTDPQAKVEKLMSAGFISAGSAAGADFSACDVGGCGAGACGASYCGGDDF